MRACVHPPSILSIHPHMHTQRLLACIHYKHACMPCMHPHINACTHEKYMHACLHTHTLVHVSLYLCRHVCVRARALCVCVYNARTSTDTPHANFLGVGGRRDLVRALNCCAVRHRVGEWNSHFDDLPGIAHHADDQQTHAPVGSGARAANPSSGI